MKIKQPAKSYLGFCSVFPSFLPMLDIHFNVSVHIQLSPICGLRGNWTGGTRAHLHELLKGFTPFFAKT